MTSSLFAYILKYSKRQQLTLIAIIVCAFPFYYFSLDLPKTIINDAINGSQFPIELVAEGFGISIPVGSFDQISYLVLLCIVFLILVVINGGFKYAINVYRGVLGERMLRRLRFQLIERVMKFPLSRFRRTGQGELVSMVNQETEPLAGFIGECISLPLYQGGMMITILIFMFIQDWKLGIAAIALYPLQTWLIPKLQRQVNALNQRRIIHMRQLAENLGETVSGINEIRVNNSSDYLKSTFSQKLGGIFDIRVQIFRKKYFIKFLNSFIGQITPFLFFLVGGILVIRGELSFGALVAVLAAYKDLSPPWKELLAWYQLQTDARMKFTLLVEQFGVEDSSNASAQPEITAVQSVTGSLPLLEADYVSLEGADGSAELNGISMTVKPGDWVRIVGSGSSGKNALAHVLANIVKPTSGKLLLDNQDTAKVSDSVISCIFGYSGHDSYLFSRSIQDNLIFGLKQLPSLDLQNEAWQNADTHLQHWREEARLSGNSDVRADLEWVDYQRAGVTNSEELMRQIGAVLKVVNLEDELVRIALTKTITESEHPKLVKGLMQARQAFKSQISRKDIGSVVETLDPKVYNNNASVAENMLFGAAIDTDFSVENLADNLLIRSLLEEYDLFDLFHTESVSIAATLVDIFADLPPGHEFFDRYSLIDADEVVLLKSILSKLARDNKVENLDKTDRALLNSLPFRIIAGRHRLGIPQAEHKEKIVEVRQAILNHKSEEVHSKINFFQPERYSDSSSIGDNIIFGRVNFTKRGAADIVYRQVFDILKSLDLVPLLLEVGLSAPAGLAGSLLPLSRRQKINLGKALLKRPDILVINEGLNSLDTDDTHQILQSIKKAYPDMSLIWIDSQEKYDDVFVRSIVMDAGKISRSEDITSAITDPTVGEIQGAPKKTRAAASVLMNEKIDLVSRIPIFRSLDRPSLQLIAKTSSAVNIPKGERLFKQGDTGDALYVIVEGLASVVMQYGDIEVSIAQRGMNEVIGELAVLSDEPRTASVDAITDLLTLRLDREDFLNVIQTHGDVGYQLLHVITAELVDLNRRTSADSWNSPAVDAAATKKVQVTT